MKTCPHCGKEIGDAEDRRPFEGEKLRSALPCAPAPLAPGNDSQQVLDAEHIRLLSIFHFVVGGLALCGVAFLLLHYFIMSSMFSNPDFFKSQPNAPQMPKDFFKFFIGFYIFMGVILAAAALGNLLSGIFLRQRKHRAFSMVIGGLNCLQIPFGTVLGIFTIIVLARESVRRIYQR